MPVVLAIIGTAGRDDSKRPLMTPELYRAMYLVARDEARLLKPEALVSGGAAWSDHVAVSLFLGGEAPKLVLHLPCTWHELMAVQPYPSRDARTARYYHHLFSEAMGKNSLESLGRALKTGAVFSEHAGFHARNAYVASAATHLLAFTWGAGEVPARGGTAHTWKLAQQRGVHCRHVPLTTLL